MLIENLQRLLKKKEGMNSDEVKECFTECTKAFGMELRRQLTKHRKKEI